MFLYYIIYISGLFDIMTLNMCHMLHSTPRWFSPSLESVNLSVPDVFSTDTSRHAVTLTFNPLTLIV